MLPCAGTGSRAGAAGPKQYVPLAGQPLVLHTLSALAAVGSLRSMMLVISPEDTQFDAEVAPVLPTYLRLRLTVARCGGATRADTVLAGLGALREAGADGRDWVLVHDAARCLIDRRDVVRLIDTCFDDPVGGLLALPVADTLKAADADDRVTATVDRAAKWAAQTPQMFRLDALEQVLRSALADPARAARITDEASAFELAGLAPRLVRGRLENLKVTWPEDFALAERLLRSRA